MMKNDEITVNMKLKNRFLADLLRSLNRAAMEYGVHLEPEAILDGTEDGLLLVLALKGGAKHEDCD